MIKLESKVKFTIQPKNREGIVEVESTVKNLSEITVFDSLSIFFYQQEGVMSNKKREKMCCNVSETN